jgi:NhaP-type Na+/H+ or K+/H+ antiporter
MVTDTRLPARFRQTLNVESGLNDGICTPFVTVAIAGLATLAGIGPEHTEAAALRELVLGLAIGIGIGVAGGWLLDRAARLDWMDAGTAPIALLALPVLAYGLCLLVHGNGFVAAFVAGIACSPFLPPLDAHILEPTELAGQVLSTVVWFVFGAALRTTIPGLTWHVVLYAVLSLTVIRMVPVALSLIGAGLDRPTVGFIGWFGPRGLASIVFALVALEDLGPEPTAPLLQVVSLTVLGSVVLHGVSAAPLAERYRRHTAGLDRSHPVHGAAQAIPLRRTLGPSASTGD